MDPFVVMYIVTAWSETWPSLPWSVHSTANSWEPCLISKPKEGKDEVRHGLRLLPLGCLGRWEKTRRPPGQEGCSRDLWSQRWKALLPVPLRGCRTQSLFKSKSQGLQWLLEAATLIQGNEPLKRPARHFRTVFWCQASSHRGCKAACFPYHHIPFVLLCKYKEPLMGVSTLAHSCQSGNQYKWAINLSATN